MIIKYTQKLVWFVWFDLVKKEKKNAGILCYLYNQSCLIFIKQPRYEMGQVAN